MTQTSVRPRIAAVDVVRGVIMIIMALDHVRDFLAPGASPTNLATATAALFFTRWITNFCAPVFFLLTGTGARLSLGRKGLAPLTRFLWTRGLWLLFLEVVLLRCLAWQFNFDYQLTLLSVLWALGWAMIVLSLLIHLPTRVVVGFGLALIALHNLADSVAPERFGALAPFWIILHRPGVVLDVAGHVVFSVYPLIPWIGVTAIGWGLGAIYQWDAGRRRRFLKLAGVALTVAFVVLRLVNGYGDPAAWSAQRTPLFTLLSFLNTSKYPPSLLFLLMTLGPALLFLAVVDGVTPRWLGPAAIVGKVPMFFYMVHALAIHLVAVVLCWARYGSVHWMFESPSLANFPITAPPGWDLPLPLTWLVWLGLVLALYPLCRWWAGYKARHREWWVSYL